MLPLVAAILAAAFAIHTFPCVSTIGLQSSAGFRSSAYSLANIWFLITQPEFGVIVTSTAPVFLSLIHTKFNTNVDILKHRQDISPIPMLDLLYGPYCKSLDLFKPVLVPNPESGLIWNGVVLPSTGLSNISSDPNSYTLLLGSQTPEAAAYSRLEGKDSFAQLAFDDTPDTKEVSSLSDLQPSAKPAKPSAYSTRIMLYICVAACPLVLVCFYLLLTVCDIVIVSHFPFHSVYKTNSMIERIAP